MFEISPLLSIMHIPMIQIPFCIAKQIQEVLYQILDR
jgi:hypothetical protein